MESEGLVSQYDGSKPQIYIGGQAKEAELQAEPQKEAPDTIPDFLKQREGRQSEASEPEPEQRNAL